MKIIFSGSTYTHNKHLVANLVSYMNISLAFYGLLLARLLLVCFLYITWLWSLDISLIAIYYLSWNGSFLVSSSLCFNSHHFQITEFSFRWTTGPCGIKFFVTDSLLIFPLLSEGTDPQTHLGHSFPFYKFKGKDAIEYRRFWDQTCSKTSTVVFSTFEIKHSNTRLLLQSK